MTFTQPNFLWALAGIVVPVAIHLLSRKEGKVIKVGSLRHMVETNTSRFKSLRLNEIWLLIARCMMIAWLALFLSGASCNSSVTRSTTRWLVIESGIEKEIAMKSFIDSLATSGFELRYLAEGFPSDPPSDPLHVPDYWRLAEDLGSMANHDIVVVSYNRVNGFKLNRPGHPGNVRWIPLNPPDKEFVVQATRMNNDMVAVRTGHSAAGGTALTTREMVHGNKKWIRMQGYADSVMIDPRDTISVVIMSDEAHENEVRVLRASLKALEMIPQVFVEETDSETDWVFWFRDDNPSEPISSNTVLIRPGEQQDWFVQQSSSEWHLTRKLTANDALKDHFTIALAGLFAGTSETERLQANDVSALPEPMTWSSMPGLASSVETNTSRDLSKIIVILFMLTWITERTLAIRRKL
jgi:hypothetical protein